MIGLVIALLSLGIVSGQFAELRVYALPVGQGDALVVQCPNRYVTIVDMGSSDGSNSGFWNKGDIQTFFSTKKLFDKVRNIVITHNDRDHYSLIPQVFDQTNKPTALENIYISRTFDELPDDLYNWMKIQGLESKVRTINGGKEYCCTLKDKSCLSIDLCPGYTNIKAEVLFANLGCGVKTNMNSIVIRITFKEFSVILNGDFTEVPDKVCGREFTGKNKVNVYKRMKDSTVYKLAHHGSSSEGANNDEMLSVIKPKAIFVSANSWYNKQQYGHPRCSVVDYLKNTKALCKPKIQNQNDQFYCGQHPDPLKNFLQQEYTCCDGQYNCKLIKSNDYAIYSTAPDEYTINLIELVTDGTNWGFINDPKAKTGTTSKPGTSPTATKPVTRPTATKPVTRPTATKPVTRPTATKPVTRPTATKPVTRPTATKSVTRPTATKRPSDLTNPTPKKPKTRRRNLEIASFLKRVMLGEKEIPIKPAFE